MGRANRLRILLWKNFTLKKRHYISTTCEILLPTIFAIGIAISRGYINRDDLLGDNTYDTTYRKEFTHLDLMNRFSRAFVNVNQTYYPVILYTPQNDATDAIIQNMNETYQTLIDNMDWEYNRNCSEPETNCSFGVWRAEENEKEMEELAYQYFNDRVEDKPDYPNGELTAGIVFTSDMTFRHVGGNFSYKLRLTQQFGTGELFDLNNGQFTPYEYEHSFIGLQIMLDLAIMKYQTNQVDTTMISVQGFPYPPEHTYAYDVELLYFMILPQAIVLGFLFVIPSTLRILVNEKETGVHELLTLMGLPKWMHWVGNFLNSMMVLSISVTIVVAVFYIPFFEQKIGPLFRYGDPTLWWILLWLYAAATTTFCFFISTLFNQPAIAIPGGIAICIIGYYPVQLTHLENLETVNIWMKFLMCIIPNNAIHYGTLIIADLEINKIGAGWSDLNRGITETDHFGLYVVLLMLAFDACLYMFLSMYLEKVIPSTYGIRKAWYYIFLPSEWGIGHARASKSETWDFSFAYRQDPEAFEKEPKNVKVGIDIRKLRKEFDDSVAVAGMDLKMYEGQITALLGQNGAGKTTAMSMLIGMITPTSGTAFVNGHNIRTEMEKVRTNLSLCPQHNMLFNQLSVKENLNFFGRLSGLSPGVADEKSEELLTKLRLENKRNSVVAALSGGEKRKVSFGCAIINGSKVVILDEPTSGLDVENRSMIWDLLLKFRVGRTIVLSTHFMEEADILGDRIVIMDRGELMCVGTPMFLKNYYGTGYVLKLSLDSNLMQEKILETIQSIVPGARIIKRKSGYLRELLIAIQSTDTSEFPQLFLNLERKKSELGIQNFALAQTSMEDVFVRVGEIAAESSITEEPGRMQRFHSLEDSPGVILAKISGKTLLIQRFWILMKKRTIYALRRKVLLLFQVIIPVLLLIFGILLTNSSFRTPQPADPPLTMTLESYNDPITAFSSTIEHVPKIYEAIVGSSAERVVSDDMEEYYLEVGKNDIATFKNRYIVGAAINETSIKAMHSIVASHAISLSVNLVMSTLLQNLTGLPLTFEVTNHPFHNEVSDIQHMAYYNVAPSLWFIVVVPISLGLLVAPIIILPIEERRSSAKHLQLMTGVHSIVYWMSFFVVDFIFYTFVAAMMVTCFPIFEYYETFSNQGGAVVAFFILLAFAFQTIPFIYLISLGVRSVAGGLTILTIFFILTCIGFPVLMGTTQEIMQQSAMYITWIPRLLPGYGIAHALETFSVIAISNAKCNVFTEEQKRRFCFPKEEGWGMFGADPRECCDECGQDGFPDCYKQHNLFDWTTTASYFTKDLKLPGLNQELLGMFLTGLLYGTILIIIENGFIKQIKIYLKYWCNQFEFNFNPTTEDDDIIKENNRVETLVLNDKLIGDDTLVVKNLCKIFGTFPAVASVSYGVQHGECFGLLGVNGAGKSTIFRMLTGETTPSMGNAYITEKNLVDDKSFLQGLGYCPQFDGTVGYFTGNEILEVFGILRGISRSDISQEVSKWMLKIGLNKSAKMEYRNYSGGMKRRLAMAMAMIGEPKVVLLDEPTTGVDPIARRQFGKTITSLITAGQSIVLISHSMEECEKLCNRLAIMVNGEFQCLGDVDHLKEKYAEGFNLTVKLKFMSGEINASRLNNFRQKILNTFSPCTLNLLYQNILEFHLTNKKMGWSFLFAWMESLRYEFRDILEDYAIKQTTLEEVFLSFARQQTPEHKRKKSLLKRIKCCA